jgi:hypothetical protein
MFITGKEHTMTTYEIKLATNKSTGLLPTAQHAAAKRQLNKFLQAMPVGTEAYIAGGAPRDWHHGWGCRDVDIFFHVPEQEDALTQATQQLSKYKLMGKAYGSDYSYGCGEQGINSIYEYPIHQGSLRYRTIQLIWLRKRPLDVIRNFPMNMSHIWMDRNGIITCDYHYRLGYNSSVLRPANDSQYIYPYLEKILPRYSHYAFIPTVWDQPEDIIKESEND